MPSPPQITIVGGINVDLSCPVPRIPAEGETLRGGDLRIGLGGKGANQAVAAARLGAVVHLIACVGDDPLAAIAQEAIRREGIDQTHVRTVPGPTGTAVILVEPEGGNRIVISGGANVHLAPGDVENAMREIARSDLVLVNLEIPMPAVVRAFEVARELGIPLALNPAPAVAEIRPHLDGVDYVIPNAIEAAQLSGVTASEPEEALDAALVLRQSGARSVVVTLGAEGAVWADGLSQGHIPAEAVKALDTTGAGDAFVGCLAVALASGCQLHEAVSLANRAGALAVTRWGAADSLPGRAEVGF